MILYYLLIVLSNDFKQRESEKFNKEHLFHLHMYIQSIFFECIHCGLCVIFVQPMHLCKWLNTHYIHMIVCTNIHTYLYISIRVHIMQTRASGNTYIIPKMMKRSPLRLASFSIVLVFVVLQRERNLSTLCLHHKCQN